MATPWGQAQAAPIGQAQSLPPIGQVELNFKRLLSGLLLFTGAIIAVIAAVLPWWSLSETGGSTGGLAAHFVPGSTFVTTYYGATASTTYAGSGIGTVGALYEGVLALLIGIAVIGIVSGVLAAIAAFGKLPGTSRYFTIRNLTIVEFILTIPSVLLVPLLQPALFARDDPSNMCGVAGSVSTPCNSFWGSVSARGVILNWGSDIGWYLAIGSFVIILVATITWMTTSREAWGPGGDGTPSVAAGRNPPGSSAMPDLDRLVQMKQLMDSGHLTAAEFQQLKARVLGPGFGSSASAQSGPSPEEELRRLKTMHDSEVITDQEYEELRKRVLAKL